MAIGGFQILAFQPSYQQQQTAVVTEQPNSGGYGFLNEYEAYRQRWQSEKRRRKRLEEEAQEIADETAREIARFLHEQESKDAERANLERLRLLVGKLGANGSQALASRVQNAYLRVLVQGNFSALLALERELERMLEEEEIAALMLLLNEDD